MSKVIVIGESCTDEFVYCSASRLAPDLPIPILNVIETITNPGMAMNVARNIKTYVPDCDVRTNYNWKNLKKTRFVEYKSNHTFIRVDSIEEIEPFRQDLDLTAYGLVVISDYDKGFLSIEDIIKITNQHKNVFLDTKKILGDWAENAAYVKINDFEFQRSKPFITQKLSEKIIRTLGSEGCEFSGKRFEVPVVKVKDSSGAGDSFFAALVVKFLETSDIFKSIEFANLAASKVVSERGVTII